MKTGRDEHRATSSATEPRTVRLTPVRPCEPMAMKSTSSRSRSPIRIGPAPRRRDQTVEGRPLGLRAPVRLRWRWPLLMARPMGIAIGATGSRSIECTRTKETPRRRAMAAARRTALGEQDERSLAARVLMALILTVQARCQHLVHAQRRSRVVPGLSVQWQMVDHWSEPLRNGSRVECVAPSQTRKVCAVLSPVRWQVPKQRPLQTA